MTTCIRDYRYYREVFAGLPLPLAFVDMDLLNENSKQILQRSNPKDIRVATKSIRCISILEHILQADTRYIGVMSFTAQEALYLAERGIHDILLGYPVWQTEPISQLIKLIADGQKITFMADSLEHLQHIEQIARQVDTKVKIPICLDLDMYRGDGRCFL